MPRPWPHTIYIPLIWFFSILFAVPTIFWSDVRPLENDFYRNDISYRPNPADAMVSVDKFNYCKQTADTDQFTSYGLQVCMHTADGAFFWGDDKQNESWASGSNFFYITSTLVTFCIPVLLLFIPWWALLVQICACCTRKLRSSEFWLSLITLFLILFYEASR